jgi:uncharacterized membrane protein YcgQ (UPF0703/DUF1980 family)
MPPKLIMLLLTLTQPNLQMHIKINLMQHTMQQLTLRRWLRKHYLRIRAMHPYPYPQHVLQRKSVICL